MKKQIFMFLMFAACVGAQATVVTSYDSRLELTAEGVANVTVSLQLKDVQPGHLVLPTAFGRMENLQLLEVPAGTKLVAVTRGDQSTLEMDLNEGAANPVSIRVAFTVAEVMAEPKAVPGKKPEVPAGSHMVRHVFVNTQAVLIERYRVDLVLPEGYRVQLIREQLPKPKRSELLPRVRLDGFDGRQGAQLLMSSLRQGDRTSMVLEVVNDQRSIGWLVIGVAISIAYLFGFSDLVRREKSSSVPA